MHRKSIGSSILLIIIIMIISIFLVNCKKTENNVKFPLGTFPDTVLNLEGLNSPYDDYNSALLEISGTLPLIFSSNRKSSGGQFDLEQGLITFSFNRSDGSFQLTTGMTQDPFLSNLITAAVTPGNDFGPYRVYSSIDGLEYLILASENSEGNLDLRYCTNMPQYGSNVPAINGPYPVNLVNSAYNDAYLSFNLNLDTAYFNSDADGNFDIYVKAKPEGMAISDWFNSDFSPSAKVDGINSPYDDKCPMVYKNLMVFTSNRPGGYGGYDLYYSVLKNGSWTSPVNLGPEINTSSDEYRPLLGNHSDFTNIFMIFSSDRTGGKGGFDLYFTGLVVPSQ